MLFASMTEAFRPLSSISIPPIFPVFFRLFRGASNIFYPSIHPTHRLAYLSIPDFHPRQAFSSCVCICSVPLRGQHGPTKGRKRCCDAAPPRPKNKPRHLLKPWHTVSPVRRPVPPSVEYRASLACPYIQ